MRFLKLNFYLFLSLSLLSFEPNAEAKNLHGKFFRAKEIAGKSKIISLEEQQMMEQSLDEDGKYIDDLTKMIREQGKNYKRPTAKEARKNRLVSVRYRNNLKVYKALTNQKYKTPEIRQQEQQMSTMKIKTNSDFGSSQEWISRIKSTSAAMVGFSFKEHNTCKE